MSTITKPKTAEAEVRALIESWEAAVQAVDFDAIMSHYAPDILSFDAVSQLQFKGVDAYRKHWETCMTMCPGPMIFEIHDLNVVAGDDLAFAHYLNRCGGVDTESGEEKAGFMRATVCLRKIDGRWRIVHEHFSAPFDMETSQALLELVP